MVTTLNLFISHSWDYTDAYDKLSGFLNARPYFEWNNFSVPKNDPVHTSSDAALRAAIEAKLRLCHVVLIVSGVYATYSKWINIEIDLAQNAFSDPKPIVAIRPWGAERTSVVVETAATRTAGWNTDSIVTAIRAVV